MKTKIVSVLSNKNKIIKEAIYSKKNNADILELRFDLLYQNLNKIDYSILINKIIEIKKVTNLSLIATIRLKSEGGKYLKDDSSRLNIFKKIIPYVDYIDIEFKSKLFKEILLLSKKSDVKTIVSYHNFDYTPSLDTLYSLIYNIKSFFPTIIKVSTLINRSEDFLNLTKILNFGDNIAIIPMAYKKLFFMLRLFTCLLGSSLIYTCISNSIAPGQPNILLIKKFLNEYYK
jgi:3-dehydroquinate dehydratase-1